MVSKYLCGLLLISSLFPCFAQVDSGQASRDVPRLISGDLPRYPPIAEAAAITGQISMRLHVEKGTVIGAELLSADLRERGKALASEAFGWLTTPLMENLKTWRFDKSVNTTFVVHYTYDITGTPTDNPTNPEIEISPSLDVRITARPVKPTINY